MSKTNGKRATAAEPRKGKEGVAKTASSKRPKKRTRAPVSVTCKATKRNGKPCGLPPIKGGTVCHKHGGSAPQVRAAANRRLIEMVVPAMKELHRILNKPDAADADKLKAIQMVLNRTGYNERHQIDIGLREPTPFDRLTSEGFVIMRGEENIIDSPQEREALESGGGDDDADDALADLLGQRQRARQREASTRLPNKGHDVVEGRVVSPEEANLFGFEMTEAERYRASAAGRATEHDPYPSEPRDPDADPDAAYEKRLRDLAEGEK